MNQVFIINSKLWFYFKFFNPTINNDNTANTTTDMVLEILKNCNESSTSDRIGSELPDDLMFFEGMFFCFYEKTSMRFWAKFAEMLGAHLVDSPEESDTYTFTLPKYIKKFKKEYPKLNNLYNPSYFVDNLLFVETKTDVFPIKNFCYNKSSKASSR